MTNHVDHKTICHLEEHEGSLYYTDLNGRASVQAVGAVTFLLYKDEHGTLSSGWNVAGYLPAAMEALATYYALNPGFKEGVDGLYEFIKQRRGLR